MRKKLISLVAVTLIAVLICGCFVTTSFGTSTKKMKVYDEVIVVGNNAYCSTYKGLYRVNIKTGAKKCLDKNSEPAPWLSPWAMKYYKGYIYYMEGDSIGGTLYRVSTSGKNKKYLGWVDAYAISNNRLYCMEYAEDNLDIMYKVMNLNGKNKRKSSVAAEIVHRRSNKKGYKIKMKDNGKRSIFYLVKPSGKKIKLCACEN